MTAVDHAELKRVADDVRALCNGHPHAQIAWPHRPLHDIADRLDALRTQAPDSWRPDREAVDAAIRSAICGHDGRIMTGDFWPGIDAITDAILALRPQTAESGT